MLAVVTGKVTVPAAPAVIIPFCVPTDTVLAGKIVRVNDDEVVPLIVSVRVGYVPAVVPVVPASLNVPLLPLMVTLPETVTPDGKLATVAA